MPGFQFPTRAPPDRTLRGYDGVRAARDRGLTVRGPGRCWGIRCAGSAVSGLAACGLGGADV